MKNYLYYFLLIFGVFNITSCELMCEKIYGYEVCKDKRTDQVKFVKIINSTIHSDNYLHINRTSSIASRAFANQETLRRLSIDGSSYHFGLEPDSFVGLKNLKSLDIHRTFVKLDKNIFFPLESLEYLSLSIQGNSKELENKLTTLRSLKGLEIFHSFLNTIGEKSFNSLTSNIQRLSLIDCNISSIEPMSFWTLNHLEVLVLNENKLTILKSAIFYGLKKLKYLFISSNNIKTIKSNIFDGLANLIELDLSHNKIDKIDKYALIYTRIGKLFLEHNSLTILEPGIFDSINCTLKEIHLQYNHIDSIGKQAFFGMHLNILNLRDNNLQIIPGGSFEDMTIVNLFLESENNYHINKIENGAFKNSKVDNIFISNRESICGNTLSWGLTNSTRVFSNKKK